MVAFFSALCANDTRLALLHLQSAWHGRDDGFLLIQMAFCFFDTMNRDGKVRTAHGCCSGICRQYW